MQQQRQEYAGCWRWNTAERWHVRRPCLGRHKWSSKATTDVI